MHSYSASSKTQQNNHEWKLENDKEKMAYCCVLPNVQRMKKEDDKRINLPL